MFKEKITKRADWRWLDFVLNFAMCSANFYLHKQIHDLVSVP